MGHFPCFLMCNSCSFIIKNINEIFGNKSNVRPSKTITCELYIFTGLIIQNDIKDMLAKIVLYSYKIMSCCKDWGIIRQDLTMF